ncbi:MAG: hypothetical protein NT034_00075 [Candidatus Magasanikbacteria bacterium]|nr:hypothetical protein [Candidatus Magasanikbacteria bacterium]
MPAKKGGKKKKQNPADSEMKPMPSLVFNNIRMTHDLPAQEQADKPEIEIPEKKSDPQKSIREKFVDQQLARHNKMTYWFYAGMAVILAAIIFFWGFSLWSNLTSINWKKTEEKKIMDKTSTDLNQAFQTDKQNELQNQLTKLQIKQLLQQAIKNQPPTTTTSTTTPTSTTTTITNTSTIPTTTKN